MSTKNTGGSAFPCHTIAMHEGMTLRDYFAAKAMQAWLVGVDSPVIDKCARAAYEVADAMLEARK